MSDQHSNPSQADGFAWMDSAGFNEDMDLAETILKRTRSVQRRRRWSRHSTHALALVLAFGLGFVSRDGLGAADPSPHRPGPTAQATPGPSGPEMPASPASPSGISAPDELSAEDLEIFARANDGAERAPLFQRAGDLWLTQHDDHEAALRCYRLALSAGADREIAASDTWLYMALKTST